MCGIVYLKSFTNDRVNRRVLKQYKHQMNRGREGFGFYIPSTNRMAHHPAENRIKNLLRGNPASEVLFHHRFPTSTDNVRNACHPFSTKSYFGTKQYVMVHNGYLYNEAVLKADHTALGVEYVSVQPNGRFNDSEALMWDIALYLEGDQAKLEAQGAIAFVMIERENDVATKLHFARNTSPLNMLYTESELMLSSEGPGKPIEPDMLYTYDYASGELTTIPLEIPDYSWSSSRESDYSYYAKAQESAMERLDTAEEAATIFGDANFSYAEALGHAYRMLRSHELNLTILEDEADFLTNSEELEINLEQMMNEAREVEYWQEVVGIVEEWQRQDTEYAKTRAITGKEIAVV
jgi:asparagine synthetase B (glutamine-hydrolysing)